MSGGQGVITTMTKDKRSRQRDKKCNNTKKKRQAEKKIEEDKVSKRKKKVWGGASFQCCSLIDCSLGPAPICHCCYSCQVFHLHRAEFTVYSLTDLPKSK